MKDILPLFSTINSDTLTSQINQLLQSNLEKINRLIKQAQPFTWLNLMQPLEEIQNELERIWSPFAHLHAVVNSDAKRECYQACLPLLSAYESAIGQNQALYHAIQAIDQNTLNPTQQKIVQDSLRDFKLSGVNLPPAHKKRLENIDQRLAELANQFDNHVLDATQAYHEHVTNPAHVFGLPEHALKTAQTLAQTKNLSGWLFSLEAPSYSAIMTYADHRPLREKIYYAYTTRASEVGPYPNQFDNTPIINELLVLKHEKSQLLGFQNYAEYALATKMADSPKTVFDFLTELQERGQSQAAQEFAALQAFTPEITLEPWDIAYCSEKKRQDLFSITQEILRPYFPLPNVCAGLFKIIKTLYGIHFEPVNVYDKWHEEVECYALIDQKENTCGYVYMDLFARPHKRGGAWMDACQGRRKEATGEIQLPIAFLTCNFAKTSATQVPTLSHDEVITLFHEMGHCLQHLLTQVDYLSASGINGIEWDAVELPSQFFENWCWEKQALQILSKHIDSGETLPDLLLNQLIAAKNFQSAMALMRQLEFALFDFRLHASYNPENPQPILSLLHEIREKTSLLPAAEFNRFPQTFSHIFAGGYAAGYYSYKWAEVLSADAFARFKQEGIFNSDTGQAFLKAILEVGSAEKAADAFINFRGRLPTIDALLVQDGIHLVS